MLIQNTPAWKTRMSQVLWEITGEQLSGAEFNSWVGAEPFSIVQALIDDGRRAAQNDQAPTTPDSRLEMLKKILGEANQLINQ